MSYRNYKFRIYIGNIEHEKSKCTPSAEGSTIGDAGTLPAPEGGGGVYWPALRAISWNAFLK
jgi:hypothetical protein